MATDSETDISTSPDKDIPPTATKVKNQILNDLLKTAMEDHRVWKLSRNDKSLVTHSSGDIKKALEKGLDKDFIIRESGDKEDSPFKGQANPIVEGCKWFRGYAFMDRETGGQAFIFISWTKPGEEKRDPIIYQEGNIPGEALTKVVSGFIKAYKSLRPEPALV